MVPTCVLEEWRFFMMEFGELCVMMVGIYQMLQWCVDNWAVVLLKRQRAKLILGEVQDKYDIRLVNGINLCSGRVEIRHNGVWGTVCDNGWDLSDAAVVCRQLGCGAAKEAKSKAYFGKGSGRIWLDNVACTGKETTLKNCSASSWGKNKCGHHKDAGVICQCE
ncbi:Scavenger receptor cysteine-rich domain-containing group B protein [Triplophysa tibetana]|uniref:Scavenger receptor cysteine-rich domain-containing group B protein n=1 Tax=Triplophysa tibetana TaxID=1572043 RepID=A0A5A9PST5_9TELE|nr:Scavenger receptor cysteine-rich domain-containing group B protein [Triplophysa tibetana]